MITTKPTGVLSAGGSSKKKRKTILLILIQVIIAWFPIKSYKAQSFKRTTKIYVYNWTRLSKLNTRAAKPRSKRDFWINDDITNKSRLPGQGASHSCLALRELSAYIKLFLKRVLNTVKRKIKPHLSTENIMHSHTWLTTHWTINLSVIFVDGGFVSCLYANPTTATQLHFQRLSRIITTLSLAHISRFVCI